MLAGQTQKEHALNRLGYGQSRWHSDRYDALGYAGYVAEQLGGTLAATAETGTTIATKLERSILSQRQLETTLLDFWFNHFNVSTFDSDPEQVEKTIAGRKIGHHQNVAIAPHVLGSFNTMLLETAYSPSMLDYLDNRINYEEEIVNGVQFGLNENYAREVMELHTIGVDGGYSEADIIEVARILTGWSVSADEFKFKTSRHDRGAKTVMGVSYPAGRDIEEGIEFLAWLAAHPSAAQFLGGKLVTRFIGAQASAGAFSATASAYATGDGDLGVVMPALFAHAAFLDDASFRSKVKPPHRYVASAVLAMGAQARVDFADLLDDLVAHTINAGEVPYVADPPTGYPDEDQFWISGASMITRFQIAEQVAYHPPLRERLKAWSGADGVNPLTTVTQVARVMVPGDLSSTSRTAVLDHVAANAATNDGRVSAAAHMIMCSPEFVRF